MPVCYCCGKGCLFMKDIKFYGIEDARRLMNDYAGRGIPFLFVISYDGCRSLVLPVDEVDPGLLRFSFNGYGNCNSLESVGREFRWQPHFPDFETYRQAFNTVRSNILRGNSYLVNLTCRVPVETDLTLKEIYMAARAPFRLWLKDTLVCFSPEKFVTVEHGRISSFPMKGTIDASLPDAETRLMNDVKEAAEHATIVDLIRNDLSMVASGVHVDRYRYVERLRTNRGELLQTSSEISGRLPEDWLQHVGDMLFSLFPAGSITGAPKPMTLKIINDAEQYDRGFYTGVAGVCHEGRLDSAVLIRFIDTDSQGRLFFKAGGGITAKSNCISEYNEVKEKTYVPVY